MSPVPGSGKILVVDDDVCVAETLELIFLASGYKVGMAHSAEDAIELIAAWEPDVAIVDVMLPRMNGIEFGDVLRSNYPNAQVILMSGHPGTNELLQAARREGRSEPDILAKPMNPTQMLEIVARMLRALAS